MMVRKLLYAGLAAIFSVATVIGFVDGALAAKKKIIRTASSNVKASSSAGGCYYAGALVPGGKPICVGVGLSATCSRGADGSGEWSIGAGNHPECNDWQPPPKATPVCNYFGVYGLGSGTCWGPKDFRTCVLTSDPKDADAGGAKWSKAIGNHPECK
jgi:hypothetical protein